jgi:hypothetical protein
MSEFENATPRPWRKRKEKTATYEILAKQGPITVCPAVAHGKDDAELIVRAVNAFEPLKDALEELLDYRGGADSPFEDEYVMERVHVALAKARGEQ